MSHLAIIPILLPLAAGIACLALERAGLAAQRTVSLASALMMVAIAALLLRHAGTGAIDVYALGNWPAPFGIVLVLDRLSALMVAVCAALALPALIYASGGTDALGRHFHALFQFQIAGLTGAFLTGDLFNLFVFFEVLLLASYGLLVHGNGRARASAGLAYVVLNLTGSALFLIALGLLYGTLGTLNMADMAGALARVPTADQALVRTAASLLVVVFALKAALFPLSFWLPRVYGAAVAPAAALFAIMTKVGVYALLRVSTATFAGAPVTADLLQPWLMPLAIATIVAGTLGALAARRLAVVVASLVVVSTGTLLAAIAAAGTEAIAAALFYLVHSTLVAGGFFLLAGRIATARGEAGDGFRTGQTARRAVTLGAAYLVFALAICGVPPLSGFLAKLMILRSIQEAPFGPLAWTALLLSSLLPALVLARAASVLFWEAKPAPAATAEVRLGLPALAMLTMLAASPLLVAFAAPVADYARATAEQLQSSAASEAVLGADPATARERRP
ncbi:monovalent cation/H+ antiporter subunit D [Blastochloris sulfoviridis]|uniref:Monovalent cation/H+ antiporter subunit D n=1 Tax=Blastochloris sulfoviridis TaxID=50712 RepID=A0A5M6HRG5_9HYPH|nr:monovalent cation/H+ antiporter subunit D [Blastochloris sulfoviridis]KAA5598109.1 monovalent cation/H+ antiporter subunit D [Blastochloris sulfoviridis]